MYFSTGLSPVGQTGQRHGTSNVIVTFQGLVCIGDSFEYSPLEALKSTELINPSRLFGSLHVGDQS